MAHIPSPTDYYRLQVLRGLVSGVTIMKALGERLGCGTVTEGEDIWPGNDLSPSPTSDEIIPLPSASGEQMTAVSESTEDVSGGSGVSEITVPYLDGSGNEQTTTVSMNGTTGVDLTPSDVSFVQDMYSSDSDNPTVAAGNIKIYKKTDSGLVYNMIAEGGNKSLVPHRQIPTGKTLYLMSWRAAESKDKEIAIRIRSTDMDGVLIPGLFCFKGATILSKSTSGDISLCDVVPALSVVKVSGWGVQAAARCAVSWWGYLVTN